MPRSISSLASSFLKPLDVHVQVFSQRTNEQGDRCRRSSQAIRCDGIGAETDEAAAPA